jgi:amino acid permease
MEEQPPRDTIDSTDTKGEKGDLYVSNGESSTLPAYKVPSNVVDSEQVKPKKPLMTRIAHSFRRRQDNIHLNALGQEIVDPEKESTGTESHDTSRLSRKLHGRHMQMIAIGGAIGTGLFIGSGSSLATGGPLGLLIGFGLVGLMLFFVVHALGELAVMFPISGNEIRTSF